VTSNAIDSRGADHSASLLSRPGAPDADSAGSAETRGGGSGGSSGSGGSRGSASDTKPKRGRVGAVRPLGIGVVTLWLSVIVLLPLAALTVAAFSEGWAGFWDAITAPAAIAALWVTVLVSAIVAVINAVTGTLIAWVLVRDEFPGKRLVNAIIDLPFALPTIVASIVLLALYGPNSPIDVQLNATRWGLVVALLFVTLPFVVRSVQPVLIEADREVEEAAASLGASSWTTFRRVVLPTLAPAILSGTGLAFARAIGEYGSVVLIGGNIPRETQVASQYIQQQIEIDRPVNAAAVSVALLAIAFATLLVLRVVASRTQRREERDA
jgi:sulfate transport system permease protein